MKKLSDHLSTLAVRARGLIPTRKLGKTGLETTILGLGGESLIKLEDKHQEAVELVRTAYNMGINYFDTAAQYYPSEIRVGEALQDVRSKVIIATKTEDRTRDGALKCLEDSLNRLKTDFVDIWQIHHIDHMDEVNMVFRPNGALKALQEAKEQGMVRHLGITGHYDQKPLSEAIRRFPFDTALLALSAADPFHESFINSALPEAVKRGMGVIGMKVYGRGRIFEPTHLNSPADALNYVLSLPVSTAIIGHDSIKQLVENVKIAQDFQPLTRNQMTDIENKVKSYAHLALFFRKGCEKYNPWWGPYKRGEK